MKRYSVAQARAHFSDLLDAAEAGNAVVIERRGVRFRLESDCASSSRAAPPRSLIEYLDPAVLEGQWTWEWAKDDLRFVAPRKRR